MKQMITPPKFVSDKQLFEKYFQRSVLICPVVVVDVVVVVGDLKMQSRFCFFKNGPIPASFVYFSYFLDTISIIQIEKV